MAGGDTGTGSSLVPSIVSGLKVTCVCVSAMHKLLAVLVHDVVVSCFQ